jgi:hypothetical protein
MLAQKRVSIPAQGALDSWLPQKVSFLQLSSLHQVFAHAFAKLA